ncbi:MAG: endonuclease [Clostridia bacterium]|nr:endonuclease [Clostridia bacterium]
MIQSIKRSIALLIVIVMCLTFVPIFQIDVNAAATNSNVTYKYDGKYAYNWGEREEVATFLSPMALEFYKKYNITYEIMADYTGGTSKSNVPSSEMYKELQSLMKKAHSHITSYQETRPLYKYTDCENNGNSISSFYSGVAIGPAWDGGATWNREHTWPNSKGEGDSENDIMMLRPTSMRENSSRGNKAYGKSSGYYFPNSESNNKHDLRGDVARIFLYVYVRWGNSTNLSNAWGSGGVMESPEVLLEWMEIDPVDTWELGRNDSVQTITGTRNVFVDYPELGFILFGEDIPSDWETPSGMAKDGNPSAPPADSDCVHSYTNACDKDCNKCGHVRTITHTYDNECDTNCNICGYARTVKHKFDSLCDSVCNSCGETREPNHFYSSWKVIKEATENESGVESRSCLYCRDVDEREIPKLGAPNDDKPSEPLDSDTSKDENTNIPSQGDNDENGEQEEPIGFFEKIAQFFKNLFEKIASLFKKKK